MLKDNVAKNTGVTNIVIAIGREIEAGVGPKVVETLTMQLEVFAGLMKGQTLNINALSLPNLLITNINE